MARPKEGWKLREPRREGDSFTVRFTDPQGQNRELSTGTRDPVQAAVEAERIYVSECAAGPKAARGVVDPSLRLDEHLAVYLSELEKTHAPKTVDTYTTYARRFVQFFGDALVGITPAKMGDYQRMMLTKETRESVKKERSFMNTFLTWCLEQGTLAEEYLPRWPHLPKKATGTRTGRVREAQVDITAEQARAFVLGLPLVSLRARKGRTFPVRSRFVLMAETGLRPATIDRIEVPRHWRPGAGDLFISPDINKGRKKMTLPLTPRAIAALEAAHELNGGKDGVIFGAHDYRVAVERARVAAGLPGEFVPYDLRSHFISFMADAAEARAAMHLAMHSRLTTTNHYVRGQEDRAREALSALGSRGILGEGEVPMLSAKEGSRTLTGVTPPEPESDGSAQVSETYGRAKALQGTEATPETPGSWGSPETPPAAISRAQHFLDRLRSEWDALEQALAGELLAPEPPPSDEDVMSPLRKVVGP